MKQLSFFDPDSDPDSDSGSDSGFDPNVDPFVRSSDPHTSREAAEQRSHKITKAHIFCLRHHAANPDSDANAGQACFEAGFVSRQEEGRRASRTINEDFKWTENRIDPDSPLGRYFCAHNPNTNRQGKKNFLTPEGLKRLSQETDF